MLEIEYVKWVDSCYKNGWHSDDYEHYRIATCETIGIIAKETDDFLSIALSKCIEDGALCDVMTIPKLSILKRQTYVLGK